MKRLVLSVAFDGVHAMTPAQIKDKISLIPLSSREIDEWNSIHRPDADEDPYKDLYADWCDKNGWTPPYDIWEETVRDLVKTAGSSAAD